jgi:hypothetical protein
MIPMTLLRQSWRLTCATAACAHHPNAMKAPATVRAIRAAEAVPLG